MDQNDQQSGAPPPAPPSPWVSPQPQEAGRGGGSSGGTGGGKRKRPDTASPTATAARRDPSGNVEGVGGAGVSSDAVGVATNASADGGVGGVGAAGTAAEVAVAPVVPLPPTLPTAYTGGGNGGSISGGGERPAKIPRRDANYSDRGGSGASAGASGAGGGAVAGTGIAIPRMLGAAGAAGAVRESHGGEDARRPGRGKGRGSSNDRGGSAMQEEEEAPEGGLGRQHEEEQLQRPGKMPRRGGSVSAPALSGYVAGNGAGSAAGTGGRGGGVAGGSSVAATGAVLESSTALAGRIPRRTPGFAPAATGAAPAAPAAVPLPRVSSRRRLPAAIDVLGVGPALGRAAGVEADGGGGSRRIRTNAIVVHGEDGAGAGAGGGGGVPEMGVLALGRPAAATAAAAAATVPSGDVEEDGSDGAASGRNVGFASSPHAEGLTGDDFQCNICWELLARPVTLACGHTACESCMAKYLRAQAQAQAQIGNLRVNRISCPAGCQRMIPLVLPEVTTMIQKLLMRGFPRAYVERLQETEAERALVLQVRRIADNAAAESRRRRRRHHAGGGAAAGGGVPGRGRGALGGGAQDVVGFGNVPPGFMQGLHGQQNAARFRLDVAVPQREIPPTVARWYKGMGLGLFVCLCVSWQHPNSGEGLWHPNLVFWRSGNHSKSNNATLSTMVVGDDAQNQQCTLTFTAGEAGGAGEADRVGGSPGTCSDGLGRGVGDGEELVAGRKEDSAISRWLFSMEMNAQEYIVLNRWTALRSLYPTNNPWSSPLFLYLEDPVLKTSSSTPPEASSAEPPPGTSPRISGTSDPYRGGGSDVSDVGDVSDVSDVSDPNDVLPSSFFSDGGSSGGAYDPSSLSSLSSGPVWLSKLPWPARYCLGAVEAASSSVARIFLDASSRSPSSASGDGDADIAGTSGASTAAAVKAAERGARGKQDAGESGEIYDEDHTRDGGGDSNGGSDAEAGEGDGSDGSTSSGGSGGSSTGWRGGSGQPDTANSTTKGSADGGSEQPRRLFLEFFGPIVSVFSALGFPGWMAEFLTVVAAQLCPLLAAMPLLHLTSRRVGGGGGSGGDGENADIGGLLSLDYSLDLVIYAVFTLVITTITFWRITWKAWKRERERERSLKLLLIEMAIHLGREVAIIKVVFPLVEHLLFRYILQWQTRYLIAWAVTSLRLFTMKLLACLRVALVFAAPFLPRGLLNTLEALWCHVFTYLLLGTRFFNAFFVGDGPRRHGGGRAARRWVRAMRDARAAGGGAGGAGAGAGAHAAAVANLAGIPDPPLQPLPGAAGAAGPAAAAAGAADAAGAGPIVAPAGVAAGADDGGAAGAQAEPGQEELEALEELRRDPDAAAIAALAAAVAGRQGLEVRRELLEQHLHERLHDRIQQARQQQQHQLQQERPQPNQLNPPAEALAALAAAGVPVLDAVARRPAIPAGGGGGGAGGGAPAQPVAHAGAGAPAPGRREALLLALAGAVGDEERVEREGAGAGAGVGV